MKGFGFHTPDKGFKSGSPKEVFGTEQIVEGAFNHFRKVGFPYRPLPLHSCLQEVNRLARSSNKALLETSVGGRTADTYHPHRFHGRHHNAKRSPFGCYQDDDHFRRCIRRSYEMEGLVRSDFVDGFRYFGGSKACSNFRAGFALFLYRKFCQPGATVLDTSMGYGGRLVGFFASECGLYIGIDPHTKSCEGNKRMAADFGKLNMVEMYCQPAEDVDAKKIKGRCDFAFTSPPYFATEIYTDEPTQSCHRYEDGVSWRDGFLFPMMNLQYKALKEGCFSCVNIADVKMGKEVYPLTNWTVSAGEAAGFVHRRTNHYRLKRQFGRGGEGSGEKRVEPVIVFYKERSGHGRSVHSRRI